MTASDAERKLRELSFLHEVAQLASSARDWDEMLRVVIGRTTDAMGAEVSSLYLLKRSDGLLRLVATNGLNRGGIGRATLRVGEGIVGWVANARIPLAARDVRTDPRWKWVPEVDEKRFTSMLSVPVVARDEVIGVMNVQTVQPRDFGREEIDFLQTIANQVAGIIEKGRLQRESDRKLREVSALFEVSNVLTSTLDLDEVLSLIVDRLVRVYPGASGAILLREEDEAVRERARTGELGKTAGAAAQRALDERRPIVAFDHIAVPLIANDRLLGAVVLQVPDYKEFLEEEVRFVGALANQAALAIDKASLYALERKTTESLRELERARSGSGTWRPAERAVADLRAVCAGRRKRRGAGLGHRTLRVAARRRRSGRRHLGRGLTRWRRRGLRVHGAARARDRRPGVALSTVLVVDDERALVGMVASLLGEEGYEIVTAYDGETALRRHAEESPDLVILDRKLPKLSGDEVCKRIRASSTTPILMLTGERGADERAKLLDLGADDYLEKPFSARELRSRVRALLRRATSTASKQAAASVGRLRVDPKTHVASVDDQALDLTPTEFRLLTALITRPGEVLERRALLRAGWPEERDPDPEWLKAHLARLRSKLDLAGAPALANVRGVGYRLG